MEYFSVCVSKICCDGQLCANLHTGEKNDIFSDRTIQSVNKNNNLKKNRNEEFNNLTGVVLNIELTMCDNEYMVW